MNNQPIDYLNDKNQLFYVFGKLRWGIKKDGVITFEEIKNYGESYLSYSTDIHYDPLFIVAEHNRYPTSEEFDKFAHNYRKDNWITERIRDTILTYITK